MAGTFAYTNILTDQVHYPDVPADDNSARQQFMDLFNSIKDNMNNNLAQLSDTSALGTILRQAIINGNFSINQRVVAGSVVLGAGQYGHDRWKAGAAGCSYTFATVENVTTLTITAGSLQQVIEGSNLLTGTYTLSWVGTAQGKIGAGSYGATGITGTATGGTNLTIEFGTGTLSKVQFNFGSAIIPFSPKSIAEELIACQRYYEKSYNLGDAPGTSVAGCELVIASATNTISGFTFKTRKRVAPTVTIYSRLGTINKASNLGAADVGTSVTTVGFERGAQGITDSGTGFTVGTGYIYHWTADAEL